MVTHFGLLSGSPSMAPPSGYPETFPGFPPVPSQSGRCRTGTIVANRCVKKWHSHREFLSPHQYHPWCPYLYLEAVWPDRPPVQIISTQFLFSLPRFFSTYQARVQRLRNQFLLYNSSGNVYRFSWGGTGFSAFFAAACFACAIRTATIFATISLGTIILAPRGLITKPRLGFRFP